MLSKRLSLFAAGVAAGILVLAGCGAGGGGGGDGGNNGGPPTVTGYAYYLAEIDADIVRGTTSNEWIATSRATGDAFWGTYSVAETGIITMTRTGLTDPAMQVPTTLYAVEMVNGFLFMMTPDDAVGGYGGFENMIVAFNQEGVCDNITTQGAYNLVKTGQNEYDQSNAAGFGTAAFAAAEVGLDLTGSMFTLGMDLSFEPSYGLNIMGTACAGGMGSGTYGHFAFTATGVGVLTLNDGSDDLDYVALPEPTGDVDGAALMASGKQYVGIYQGMEDVGVGLQEVTYLVVASGQDGSILADSVVNLATGELSGVPGTLAIARAGTLSDRHGTFDAGNFSAAGSNGQAVTSAHPIGGKDTLVSVGLFDANGNETYEPEDWFFMLLIER